MYIYISYIYIYIYISHWESQIVSDVGHFSNHEIDLSGKFPGIWW